MKVSDIALTGILNKYCPCKINQGGGGECPPSPTLKYTPDVHRHLICLGGGGGGAREGDAPNPPSHISALHCDAPIDFPPPKPKILYETLYTFTESQELEELPPIPSQSLKSWKSCLLYLHRVSRAGRVASYTFTESQELEELPPISSQSLKSWKRPIIPTQSLKSWKSCLLYLVDPGFFLKRGRAMLRRSMLC